ncbi:hypothetical protein SOVF_081020 isoform B [Spinacia oleracea]|nr:hypothetical protein SOVF_081020 isoform B [Spinacia oleracea]
MLRNFWHDELLELGGQVFGMDAGKLSYVGLNWGGLAYNHLLYEMKNASRTAPESKASVASLWRVLEIWAYEHHSSLAPDRPRVAAYPFAASWEGAQRKDVSLATFRRTLRVLPIKEVSGRFVPMDPPESMPAKIVSVARLYADAMEAWGESICLSWESFVDKRSSYEDLLARLAPPVRFVPPEEEIDHEDVTVLRYEDSDGEQVDVTVPMASPPHRMAYDALSEYYAVAPQMRVHRWMLVIDSLKRHCVNLRKKLAGRDREAYHYPPYQQGTQRPSGTLRISEQDPVTSGMELDQELERYMSRSRIKEPVIDVVANDDSD